MDLPDTWHLSANMPLMPATVRVVIFDQVYHVRPSAQADAAQIDRLARDVDARMRAIAAQTRDVDSLRIAVLAALHLADEYHSLRDRHEALRAAVNQKSSEFASLLDTQLEVTSDE